MRSKALSAALALATVARLLLIPGAAHGISATGQLQAAATILGNGKCSFVTPGPYTIDFAPALNPFSAIDRSASVAFSVKCTGLGNGSSAVIVDRVGANQLYLSKGPDTIPYSLNLPTSAPVTNNNPVTVTLTATILGTAYQSAPTGSYSDTIIINVIP
jgi:hypothetical protein